MPPPHVDARRVSALADLHTGGDHGRALRLLLDRQDARDTAAALSSLSAYGQARATLAGQSAVEVDSLIGLRLRAGATSAAESVAACALQAIKSPRDHPSERRLPMVMDVPLLVQAIGVRAVPGAFEAWPAPPPDHVPVAAACLGVFNDTRELALALSPSQLAAVATVLLEDFEWKAPQVLAYLRLLVGITLRSGGGVCRPRGALSGQVRFEEARVLELAAESGALLILTNSPRLASLASGLGLTALAPESFRLQVARARTHATSES